MEKKNQNIPSRDQTKLSINKYVATQLKQLKTNNNQRCQQTEYYRQLTQKTDTFKYQMS